MVALVIWALVAIYAAYAVVQASLALGYCLGWVMSKVRGR